MANRKSRDGVYRVGDNGGWRIDWIDEYGKRQRKAFPHLRTRKEAKQFRARLQASVAEKENGLKVTPPPKEADFAPVYEKVFALFFESRTANGSRAKSYQYLRTPKEGKPSKHASKPDEGGAWYQAFKGRDLRSIRPDEIEALLLKWRKANGWSAATWNQSRAQLSSLFSFAVEKEWTERNPVEKVTKLTANNARQGWLRPHEVEAIAEASPEWMRAIVRFAAATGVRLSDVCDLRRSCFEKEGDAAALSTVRPVKDPTHTSERVTWPLSGWMREYVEARVKASKFPGDYIFPGPRGGNALSSIRRALPDAVRKAGLQYGRFEQRYDAEAERWETVRDAKGNRVPNPSGVTFHTFRHSMATNGRKSGIPNHVLKALGGWKTDAMLNRYAKTAPESVTEGAVALFGMFAPRSGEAQLGTPAETAAAATAANR